MKMKPVIVKIGCLKPAHIFPPSHSQPPLAPQRPRTAVSSRLCVICLITLCHAHPASTRNQETFPLDNRPAAFFCAAERSHICLFSPTDVCASWHARRDLDRSWLQRDRQHPHLWHCTRCQCRTLWDRRQCEVFGGVFPFSPMCFVFMLTMFHLEYFRCAP